MRKFVLFSLVALLVMVGSSFATQDEYIMAIGDYYKLDYEYVNNLATQTKTVSEVPVVLFVCNASNATPKEVMQLRKEGKTWREVIHHYRINPVSYFIAVGGNVQNDTYQAILAKVQNRQLRIVNFTDEDIINLINYRFISKSNKNCNVKKVIETCSTNDFFKAHSEIRAYVNDNKAGDMAKK